MGIQLITLKLSNLNNNDLVTEIVESANYLENKIQTKIEHFAYTFGDLSSFTPLALKISRQRFKYIYTGLRGNNNQQIPTWAIRRDAVHPSDSIDLVSAYLNGGTDFVYFKSLRIYQSWGEI